MRASIVALGLLMVCAEVAIAETPQHCAAVENSLQRLACFDKLFPKSAGTAAGTTSTESAASTAARKWEIVEEVSPLDDSRVIRAALPPVSSESTGFTEASAYLVMGCQEKTTSFVISTEMFMAGEQPSVTTRLGEEKAVTSRWTRSTNYKAVGLWNGRQAIPFIKTLKDDTTFYVRLEDKDRVDAEFNLANVSEVIEKIRAACDW